MHLLFHVPKYIYKYIERRKIEKRRKDNNLCLAFFKVLCVPHVCPFPQLWVFSFSSSSSSSTQPRTSYTHKFIALLFVSPLQLSYIFIINFYYVSNWLELNRPTFFTITKLYNVVLLTRLFQDICSKMRNCN